MYLMPLVFLSSD